MRKVYILHKNQQKMAENSVHFAQKSIQNRSHKSKKKCTFCTKLRIFWVYILYKTEFSFWCHPGWEAGWGGTQIAYIRKIPVFGRPLRVEGVGPKSPILGNPN